MPPATNARGRKRVDQVLARRGLLLIQGQSELDSVADLLAGKPITTRGYSQDHVPAWELANELVEGGDVARVKLFRGRLTLVHRRLWPAVQALALASIKREHDRSASTQQLLLRVIESQPGLPGGQLRTWLDLTAADFQKHKNPLEQRLCLFGRERDDPEAHTHESLWFPWSMSKIASAMRHVELPSVAEATETLLAAVPTGAVASSRPSTLFPVLH